MTPPKRNKRLLYLTFAGTALFAGAYLMFSALGENVSFFYSPIQIANGEADNEKRIRLGGLVVTDSIVRGKGTETSFRVTDGAAEVRVRYTGILPDLFREEQGVIAHGEFDNDRVFNADTILAKHDENYKPKELIEALESANEQIVPIKSPKPDFSGGRHVSKEFISQNCSRVTFDTEHPITGATFLTFEEDLNTSFLALSHGEKGTSLYDTTGQRLWHKAQRADIISAFGNTLLIYQKEGNSSILERFKIDQDGLATSFKIERPSEIAPTTLQRNSISSLGPISFKDNGVLLESSFVKLKAAPTAIAATKSTFGPRLQKGAVAIGLSNGELQIWDRESISKGCS